MKPSTRRRSSLAAGEKKDSEGSSKKPLRRSTRDREHSSVHPPESPVGSPKSQRTRRRTRGLPVTAQRGEAATVASADSSTTPKQVKSHASTGDTETKPRAVTRGSASKSAKKQQQDNVAAGEGPELVAIQKNGTAIRVALVVNGLSFALDDDNPEKNSGTPQMAPSKEAATTIVGNDGNLFYCVVCRGFGDVVCCDSCPHVFHAHCLPVGSESRLSLENDDDPWYCPDCMSKRNLKTPVKQGTQSGRSEGSSRRTIKHRCQECQQTRSDLSLRQCEVCTVFIHHPPCRGSTPPSDNTADRKSVV